MASLGGEERLAAQAAQQAAAALAGAGGGGAVGTSSGAGGPQTQQQAVSAYHAASAAREALLQGALARMGALHPGFRTPDGHYRVVREVADGLVGGREVPGVQGWPGGVAEGQSLSVTRQGGVWAVWGAAETVALCAASC